MEAAPHRGGECLELVEAASAVSAGEGLCHERSCFVSCVVRGLPVACASVGKCRIGYFGISIFLEWEEGSCGSSCRCSTFLFELFFCC